MHAFSRARRRRGTTVAASLTAVLATALTSVLTVLPASTAQAVTPAVGPIDPNTGYPFWYSDSSGRKYELCLDRPDTTPGMCLAAPQNPDARPWVDEDPTMSNLAADPETFWYSADAEIQQNGVRLRFVSAQEAAFGGADGAAGAGEQIAFGRVRVRLLGMTPGASYTVTQPYGTHTYTADEDGQVFVTEDLGCLDLPCDFAKANTSSLTTYLRWNAGAPAGYVGDPGVPHQVTGSPFNTNFFRVVGPNAGGPGVNTVQTNLFNVQGRLWNPTQPMLGLVSTHNEVDFGKVDLGATAPAPQTVTLTNAGGGQTPLQLQTLTVSGADSSQFSLSDDTCSGKALAPGATCTVGVSYTPAATAGTVTAQLDVPSTNGKDAAGGQRIVLQARVSDGTGKDARVTGPIDPDSGFPQWYQDESGTRVELCDDQADPMCVLPTAPEGFYDPAKPMTFPGNFPSELFWWNADAGFNTTNSISGRAVDARLVLAEEAAFVTEQPVDGDQVAFGRTRVRVDGLVIGGAYQVSTPYGDYTFVAEGDGSGVGVINYTEDIGCAETPCDFDRVNQSNIGPFLRQVNAPAGYLGNPNVPAAVTGGPNGNVFVISGPGVNAQTDLFAVSGKLAAGQPSGSSHLTVGATTGTKAITVTQPATVTLTNDGTATATPQIGLQPATSGFAVSGCASVPAGGSCTVTIALGTAAPGDTATLTVNNGTQTPITVPLQAAAAPVGTSHLTVGSTTGTTGISATQPAGVTLINDGTATATPQVQVGSGFAITKNCPSIPAGSSCTVTVGLNGATPGQTADLTVANGTQPLITVTLQAAAAPAGTSKLRASKKMLQVKPGKPAAVRLTNVGTAMAHPRLSLPPRSGFAITARTTCAATLAPRKSCTVSIGLDGAGPGDRSTLRVENDTQVLTVALQRQRVGKKR